ncbi:MAG: DUF4177 domain-containing protein [Pseudomonadota bacterium]
MERFKYQITKHPAGIFRELVYFCSESGECTLEKVPPDQTEILNNLLNEHGEQGWELVQLSFGKDGIMAFWKQKFKE